MTTAEPVRHNIDTLARNTKTYNILSIGQRGVGKTVFLIGSYLELQANRLTQKSQPLWFDCQNDKVQDNIERIINYLNQNHQYPPPTMKMTNFSFNLKQRSLWGEQTVCRFNWHDIPGEICNVHNQEFRNLVFNSHGCCVFIDAYALRYSNTYLQVLDDILEQVISLTSLAFLNNLKYPLALIMTKSDLLEGDSLSQQDIKEKLQPLTTHLETVKTNYQIFASSIPLVQINGVIAPQPKGAAASLVWLVWEVNKIHTISSDKHLLGLVNRLLPSNSQLKQSPEGTLQSLFSASSNAHTRKASRFVLLSNPKYLLLLAIAISSVGLSLFLLNAQRFFNSDADTRSDINNLHQTEKFRQAISSLEQRIQKEPESINLRLQLAQLYQLVGETAKAEATYDQILAKQNNNVGALSGKAVLRQLQGDVKTATALFKQAEQVAPDALKPKIRAMAKDTLQSPTK